MAGQRFGGPHSPGATPPRGDMPPPPPNPFRNRRARRVSLRARLTFLLPIPLLLSGLGAIGRGSASEMLGALGAYAGLTLAAWLLNEGLRAEEEYDARAVAKPPAVPRKLLAAGLAGVSVAAAGLLGAGQDILGAIVFGGMAALSHVAAFGLDPMRRKGIAGGDDFQTDRVVAAVERAEAMLAETAAAAGRIGERGMQGRVEQLCAQAREVLRAIERDPRDLGRARAFLNVYLLGLRDATVKFADIYGRSGDAVARARYEELLADLGTSFATHRTALLEDDRTSLDIEIEVLRERLQQDGLTPVRQ